MSRGFSKLATGLLLVLGVEFWLTVGLGLWGGDRTITLLANAVAAAFVPGVNRFILGGLIRLRRPSRQRARLIAILLAALSSGYLTFTALRQKRDLFPQLHDESQFLIAAHLLARGRLWMVAHPLVDFFDTFYVLINPKYAPQGFPGAAFFFVPGVWLGWASWVCPIILSGIAVGIFLRVATELLDGIFAAPAALLLVGTPMFRYISTMSLAQMPIIVLALGTSWAWLRWRASGRAGWAAAMGCGFGWMAVTRPADGLAIALPMLLAMAMQLRRQPARWRTTLAALLLPMLPWIALQAVQNVGITGSIATTPFALYNQRDQPHLGFGYADLSDGRQPMTNVPEKRAYYQRVVLPKLVTHRLANWPADFVSRLKTVADVLPANPLLLLLLPVGLLELPKRGRWVIVAPLLLMPLLYTFYPLFIPHYTVVLTPALVILALCGARRLTRAGRRWGAAARLAPVLACAAIAIGALPEIARSLDEREMTPTLRAVNSAIADLPGPAIVLLRRDAPGPTTEPLAPIALDEEPVFNDTVAWPDDAPIIRARDLGDRDIELFRYYANHGPDRTVYRYDLHAQTLTRLGRVRELAGGL
jgi:hypothetical protein